MPTDISDIERLLTTTGLSEPGLTTYRSEADPAELLPQLLDQLITLGDMACRLSHALGSNGHRPGQARELFSGQKGPQ
jgi:hypothetical protein